jgi:hypothetical protein
MTNPIAILTVNVENQNVVNAEKKYASVVAKPIVKR